METDAGDWTDRFFVDVRAEAQEQFDAFAAAQSGFAFPGGESFVQQEVRVGAALEEIEACELPALVVCHGMVIRAAFIVRGAKDFERVPNAALVPLDPLRALPQDDLGGGEATLPS
jgi:broad specificity phosphatase PhoE